MIEESQEIARLGRPSEYTAEIAAEICGELASGKSLRTVCKEESMPCAKTVFLWLRKYPDFLQQYEQAKEECADMYAEDIIDIADDGTNDWMEKRNSEGDVIGWTANGEHIQRSRLRVDSRKWVASKLKPKKYGDKTQTEITGKDGKDLIPEVSDLEAARRIAFALTLADRNKPAND